MPTHGSLSKARKVRQQTAKMQIEGRTRKARYPEYISDETTKRGQFSKETLDKAGNKIALDATAAS